MRCLFSQEHADLVFINPRDHLGKWHEVFGNNNSIAIEIGMGKGDFIIENARRNPNINFIGIEKYSDSSNYCGKEIFRNGNFTKSSLHEGRCSSIR